MKCNISDIWMEINIVAKPKRIQLSNYFLLPIKTCNKNARNWQIFMIFYAKKKLLYFQNLLTDISCICVNMHII